jgi:sulfur-carrier protein adenylyltransferase/sulfurtransferase
VLGTAVAILGSVQAHLVLHLLLGLEPTVLGRVTTFDAKRFTFGGFGFEGSPEPDATVPFIAPSALLPDDFVIDLRGVDEAPTPHAGGKRVDVAGIDAIAAELPASHRIVLCCRSGQRALMAADRLRDRGLDLALVALG